MSASPRTRLGILIYTPIESFIRSVSEESRDYFAETDRKLARLAVAQAETAELVAAFVKETNGRFAEADKRQARTDEQIKALVVSQTRTDEMVRSLLERNGSTKPGRKTMKTVKKVTKKKRGSAK